MTRRHLLLLPLTLVLALAGCASPTAFRATATPRVEAAGVQSTALADPSAPCVMEVMGTGLRYAERDDGIVLSFRTLDPARVEELRAATRGLAHVYGGSMGDARYGRHDRGQLLAPSQMDLPALETRVEPTSNGARLHVTATDGSDAERLRERLVIHAQMMQRGACPLFAPRA